VAARHATENNEGVASGYVEEFAGSITQQAWTETAL
jgi:hypothetical protein